MVTICLQCGHQGFTNAFVYCVKCLNFAVHRYCLDKIPDAFDELVYWVCDCCEVELPRKLNPSKLKSTKFEGRNHTSFKGFKKKWTVFTNKGGRRRRPRLRYSDRKRKRVSFLEEDDRRRRESRLTGLPEVAELPLISLFSTKLKNKESSCTVEKLEDNRFRPAELELNRVSKAVHGLSSFEKSKEVRKNSSATKYVERNANNCLQISPRASTDVENMSSLIRDEHAKPLMEPIWRGCFIILNKEYEILDRVAAHLSSRVGQRVYEEAKLLPSLLVLEMYPKRDLWPKSFQKSKPSDDNIALYFFPTENSNESLFHRLVTDMMRGEQALKATVTNAECLVFTSTELPESYRKFKGKYYLWGVFRAKQTSSSPATVLFRGIADGTNHAGSPPSSLSNSDGQMTFYHR